MSRTPKADPVLGKLHADPGNEKHGTKGQDESTAQNCRKYQIQSVSPIELSEALDPSHDREAAGAVSTGPKLADSWSFRDLFGPSNVNTIWLVHFSY